MAHMTGAEVSGVLRERFGGSATLRARRAKSASPWLAAALAVLLSGAPLSAQEVPASPPENATATLLYGEAFFEAAETLSEDDVLLALATGKSRVCPERLAELGQQDPETFKAVVRALHAPVAGAGQTMEDRMLRLSAESPETYALLKTVLSGDMPEGDVAALEPDALFVAVASRRLRILSGRLQMLAEETPEAACAIAETLFARPVDGSRTLFQRAMALRDGYPQDYAMMCVLSGLEPGASLGNASARAALGFVDRAGLCDVAASDPEAFRRILGVIDAPLSPEPNSREAALATLAACNPSDFAYMKKKLLRVPEEDDSRMKSATAEDVFIGLTSGRWKPDLQALLGFAGRNYDGFQRVVKAIKAPVSFGNAAMRERLAGLDEMQKAALASLLVPAKPRVPGRAPLPAMEPCAP